MGEQIKPCDLAAYRNTHDFQGPCCLCAAHDGSYKESAFFKAAAGEYMGEYVAGCASSQCGYLGKILP